MDEVYIYVFATIFDPWGGEPASVYAGCVTDWHAKDKPAFAEWKRARRRQLLADRTSDPNPRGWRVTFDELTEAEYSARLSS